MVQRVYRRDLCEPAEPRVLVWEELSENSPGSMDLNKFAKVHSTEIFVCCKLLSEILKVTTPLRGHSFRSCGGLQPHVFVQVFTESAPMLSQYISRRKLQAWCRHAVGQLNTLCICILSMSIWMSINDFSISQTQWDMLEFFHHPVQAAGAL